MSVPAGVLYTVVRACYSLNDPVRIETEGDDTSIAILEGIAPGVSGVITRQHLAQVCVEAMA